jgi:hypothetical protein
MHCFKAVARTPFNEEFMPEGWRFEDYASFNGGRPVRRLHGPGPRLRKDGDHQLGVLCFNGSPVNTLKHP